MSTLDDAIQSIRMGNREEGRQILEELLEEDEANEEIWLWLSSVVENDEDREVCLDNVLALDPDNEVARRGLEALRSGTFNINDLLADTLGGDTAEEAEEPITFLDDFVVNGDDDDFGFDDEPATKKKRGGLNIRFIILAVLVLVLVIVLGGLAVASLTFMGGDDGNTPPAESTPTQEGPGDEQPEVEPTPTPEDTPTPGPTDTPTHTPTPKLQLPTQEPTPEPSPTATTVVSPTPSN